MSAAAAWRWCLAAGLVAFACSWGFGRIPGLVACGPTGGLGPIIAFELARTPAEVAALFGSEPCRSTLVAAQRTGLWLDALGFIPSYTAFLCLAAWATGRGARRAIIAALLIAGLSDEVEGALLFAIPRDLPGTPLLTDALYWAVHLKFLLLGLGTAAIALPMLASRRVAAIAFGLGIGFGAAYALVGFFQLPDPAVMKGFTLGWAVLLAAAGLAVLHPSLFVHVPRPPARARPSA